MIKIQAMGARELKQVLNLLERFTEEDFEYRVLERFRQLYGPIQRISQALPPRWQFVPAIYVAVSKNKVLGLIWLSKDGKKETRWKIEQLIIDPDEFSFDIGSQLIHYVTNRYGAEGVQTFLATVHNEYEQALGLLKSCGFRHVTRTHAFVQANPAALNVKKPDIRGIREVTPQDRYKLKDLHYSALPTDKRLSLEKSHRDFNPTLFENLLNQLKGYFQKRWVVDDRIHDVLLGSVAISTDNYQDFQLEAIISPAWEDGFEKLLAFGLDHVLHHTNTARVFLHLYAFHDDQIKHAEAMNFSRLYDAEVLVKDYWIPLEDQEKQRSSPILLFAGKTSTAWGR